MIVTRRKFITRMPMLLALLAFPAVWQISLGSPQSGSSRHLVSSWYGDPFHGRRTASGEIFDKNKNTAAHKELPLGTKLKLSYKGRTVIVRVNDRGPYISGRDLDVSEGVALQLGFHDQGVALLEVQTLN
jgi:rare lipoprotein A